MGPLRVVTTVVPHGEFSDGPSVNGVFYILVGLRAWGTQDLVRKSQSQVSPELSSYVEAFHRDKERAREGLHSSRLFFKDMAVSGFGGAPS